MADPRPISALLPRVDDRVRLPREALDAVEWLDGESIRSVWASGVGFLVVSTLRCVLLTKGDGVHRPAGWVAGAEYLFFNFTEPKVVGVDEVELSEEFFEGREARIPVRDPVAVQQALVDAREAGRTAWALRRRADEPSLPVERPTYRPGRGWDAPDIAHPAPKTPCRFCGNLFETTGQRCPYCTAPRVAARRGGGRRR
jgi:hypothetical protein